MIDLKCKCCGCKSTNKQWDKATKKEYSKGLVKKLFDNGWKDCEYICPKCSFMMFGKEFLGDDSHE